MKSPSRISPIPFTPFFLLHSYYRIAFSSEIIFEFQLKTLSLRNEISTETTTGTHKKTVEKNVKRVWNDFVCYYFKGIQTNVKNSKIWLVLWKMVESKLVGTTKTTERENEKMHTHTHRGGHISGSLMRWFVCCHYCCCWW